MGFRFYLLIPVLLLLIGCTAPAARSGEGQVLGDRPTVTPTHTATPIPTNTPTATIDLPTLTPVKIETEPAERPTDIPLTATPADPPEATPTATPTPPFETVVLASDPLQIAFEIPADWVIDDNSEEDGVIQIADNYDTLYSGSVRRGALITVSALPNVASTLTEWITVVTSAFKDNYLLDDSQTSLTTPFEVNGYAGLRVEQRGGYTVTDPPEPVTLIIVAIEHNGWLVTIATGTQTDQIELVEAQLDHLVRTIQITAPESK